MPMKCFAYQASDQMVCGRCDVRWDMNDPHPPACDLPREVYIQPDTRFTAEVEWPHIQHNNRRSCSGCADRYPLVGVHHVLPNHEEMRCEAVEVDPLRGGVLS